MSKIAPSAASLGPRPTIGLDIGGTKCAVSYLCGDRVVEMARMPTGEFAATFAALCATIQEIAGHQGADFGISCGGPLDAARGLILNPPNLPYSWHNVPISRELVARFGGRAALMNDANACALAEWQFGAGRGCRHLVFLTSGTGMGAGLILNGRLYEGATGDAGEIGHVRLRSEGPVGYGKAGSVEGFTSGGGIARLAGGILSHTPGPWPAWAAEPGQLTTKLIADAAHAGDPLALRIMHEAGERLGEALAVLVDLFNPERIVLGGFYPHCHALFEPALRAALVREALPLSVARCEILPAALGETIGNHGAVAAALHTWPSSPPLQPAHPCPTTTSTA